MSADQFRCGAQPRRTKVPSGARTVVTCIRWRWPAHGIGILATAVTDVSVGVVDRPRGRGWARQSPRIQLKGGSYPVAEAHLLVQAITGLIGQVGGPHPSA